MKNSKRAAVLLVTALLVYAAINLVSSMRQLADAMSMTAALEQEIKEAQRENEALNEALTALENGESLPSSAREILGFPAADEIVFIDEG